MEKIVKVLHDLQTKLKVPKTQYNKFGKYYFRSCEDILTAIKPELPSGYILCLTEEMICVGDKNYIKAVAKLSNGEHDISTQAYSREAENQKGMSDAQLTGSTSSYARKYALSGLLLLDDTKDADATNTHDKQNKSTPPELSADAKKLRKDLLLLGDNDPELASNLLHSLTKKSRVQDLSSDDIINLQPKIDKLIKDKEGG